jgi:hypothetical protein
MHSVNQIHPNTKVIVGAEGLELFLGRRWGWKPWKSGATPWALTRRASTRTASKACLACTNYARQLAAGRVLLDLTLLDMADAIGIKACSTPAASTRPQSCGARARQASARAE